MCPCSRVLCNRDRPGSVLPKPRRDQTHVPASTMSAAATSTADSRPVGNNQRSRPYKGWREGSSCLTVFSSTRAPGSAATTQRTCVERRRDARWKRSTDAVFRFLCAETSECRLLRLLFRSQKSHTLLGCSVLS